MKLGMLFREFGVLGGSPTNGDASHSGAETAHATDAQRQDWERRCHIFRDAASDTVSLTISLADAGLDDFGIVAWVYWFDQRLEGLAADKPLVRPWAKEADFSGNEMSGVGAGAITTLFEKHAIRCGVLKLDGNLLDDIALKDITRYLTTSDEAPVLELSLAENPVSPKGVSWLLVCVSLHPAYPVRISPSDGGAPAECFEPLRLRLGWCPALGEDDEFGLILQDLGVFCHMSVSVANQDSSTLSMKPNRVAHLCDWSPPEGFELPPVAPYARPFFGLPPAAEVAEHDVLNHPCHDPCLLYESRALGVMYKPSGWSCSGDTLPSAPSVAAMPSDAQRLRLLEELKAHQQPCIQNWIHLSMGYNEDAEAVRDQGSDHGLCHRLDIGTSGPMIVGRSMPGYEYGKLLLRERDVVKDYVALVHGTFPSPSGSCRAPIDRSSYETERKVKVSENSGQAAVTIWEVIAEYETPGAVRESFTLVHFRLITGRTHQIRVHMAYMGHPIMSDNRYIDNRETLSNDLKMCPRIFLHKFRVSFMEMDGFPVSVSCPLRMDGALWGALQRLRLVGGMAARGCAAPGLPAGLKPGGDSAKRRSAAGPSAAADLQN